MELVWEDIPPDDGPFFTKDDYDKYSIAPNVKELWALVQSPSVKTEAKVETDKPSTGKPQCPPPTEKDKSNRVNDGACRESHDSDELSADDHNDTKTSTAKRSGQGLPSNAYQEPRVPFPFMSSLTSNEQLMCVRARTSRPPKEPPQNLALRVSSEVAQFMAYLHDVSRMCAEDYNVLPRGAELYTEEYFKACLEHMKTYPQLYVTHEMTSLTGGTFNPSLCLAFEKQLLMMGDVEILKYVFKIMPNDKQLASDYESVSSENPPAKKAKDALAAVSSDGNAEKLCARYEPHVCLTRDALVRLLNNHGPEFSDAWELPLWVKTNPGKGRSQKTVYIDSPLLQTEVTVRERSHIYHEESLKLSIEKDGRKSVSHLMTEVPVDKRSFQKDKGSSFEDTAPLDYDVELTDLETFGESASGKSSKKPASQKGRSAPVRAEPPTRSEPKAKPPESGVASEEESSAQEREEEQQQQEEEVVAAAAAAKSPRTDADGSSKEEPAETTESVPSPANRSAPRRSKRLRVDTDESEEEPPLTADALFGGDSEDERLVIADTMLGGDSEDERLVIADTPLGGDSEDGQLVIDDLLSPDATPGKQPKKLESAETPVSSAESVPDTPTPPSPQRDAARPRPASPPAAGPRRGARRAKVPGDQLGQILRMQKAMLKPSHSQAPDPAKAASSSQPPDLPSPPRAAPGHGHPQSLVKPCVSSYLESGQGVDGETYLAASAAPASYNPTTTEQKRLLSEEQLASAEDEQDYEAPEEGNLLYKLYSLQDVLVLVRSSVDLARKRVGNSSAQEFVPLHVLAKLEYQLCYGAERMTSSEACQLWAETLLHSSTLSYLARINAHTSRIAMTHKVSSNNITCDFKPSKSLNILHHLLKKTIVLEEGRYLLGHKAGEPFVTIFKAAEGNKAPRGTYDLRQAHGGVPQPPSPGGRPPWVPVDPGVIMPFHKEQGRVPCTFPPQQAGPAQANTKQRKIKRTNSRKKKNNK